jgi:hypothetical protein
MSRVSKVHWCSFRYRLRTLFVVVTVLAGILGWGLRQVHERHVMRVRIEASGGMFREMQSGGFVMIRESDPSRRVSALRKLLGDNDEETIVFPHQPNVSELEAAAVFPEAEVLGNFPDLMSSETNEEGPNKCTGKEPHSR